MVVSNTTNLVSDGGLIFKTSSGSIVAGDSRLYVYQANGHIKADHATDYPDQYYAGGIKIGTDNLITLYKWIKS